MRAPLIALLVATAPMGAAAQPLDHYFTEPLGGVYVQDWSGRVIGPDSFSGVLVFVRGDGKSGDFYGVISVDCAMPAQSKWVSTGGIVRAETVPLPAIDVIRAQACGSA